MLLFPSSRVSHGSNPGVLLTLCPLSSFSAVFLYIRLIERAKSSYHSVLLLITGYVVSDSFEALWAAAHHALLSMGFSLQEYWSVLPFPSQGILPTRGSNLCLLHWQANSFPLSHLGSPLFCIRIYRILMNHQYQYWLF